MADLAQRQDYLERFRRFPEQLAAAVGGMTEAELDYKPAPSEWSVRQIVHHLADSHMIGFAVRTKRTLTEDGTTMHRYSQEAYAELPDALTAPIVLSLDLLRALHARWLVLWEGLGEDQWNRVLIHPTWGEWTLDNLVRLYAEHGENHLRQIEANMAAMRGSAV